MIGQTITILHAATEGYDDNGDPIDATTLETDVAGCAVAPRFADETTDRGRQGTIIGYTVYAPPGTTIDHLDRVRHLGVVYDIEGQPGIWFNPYQGKERGVQFALKRGQG